MKNTLNLCRFTNRENKMCVGLVTDDQRLIDLTPAGLTEMRPILEAQNPAGELRQLKTENLPRLSFNDVALLAPVEKQEVWAAGVTYLRSKAARMEESQFSASAYDRVYDAERPELFFKSLPEKVVPTGEAVGIRHDSKWNVPEPELALVMNSRGEIVGYTIGNDMSSRDIEGENLLYLPQAKTYYRSCALGPWITLGPTETEARQWLIKLAIERNGKTVFTGETSVNQIKRNFSELASFLFRCQKFPHGAILLTGTGIVPPETFSLVNGDYVTIEITGIGTLRNHVEVI